MLISLLLTSHLNPWLVVIIGVTGSTLGRYLSVYTSQKSRRLWPIAAKMRTCVIWGLNSIKRAVVDRGGVVESLRKIFFDNFDQFRSVTRLRDNAMSFDATTVSRFFSRDKRGHENDRDAVQHPVGFDLCRHFSAVGFGQE